MEAAGSTNLYLDQHCEGADGPWAQLLPPLSVPVPPPQVVQRIKAVETETRLLVVDKETDEYLCSLRLTCTEDMVHNGILLSPALPPTKGLASDNGEVWKPQLDLSGDSLQRHSHSFSSHGSRKDLNGQKELCPRLCHLKKGPNGYGFNLHSEKSRPGQFIRSVDPDSPASRAGLRPQDRLVEVRGAQQQGCGLGCGAVALQVNGINVEGLRHSEVVSHIKSRESEARLLVVDPETDEYFKKLGVTPTEEHSKGETFPCQGGSFLSTTQLFINSENAPSASQKNTGLLLH
ncbi:Na(+)/H(+) exchange regulatory cofactor NHE-RF2, partial [Lamprotornis superbus]